MLSKVRSSLFLIIGILQISPAIAQLEGQIVGLYNPAPSSWKFFRFDPQNDQLTILFDLPFGSITTGYSATLDPITPTYYLSTGTELWILDPTGSSDPTVTDLPVPAGATFSKIEYDDCTGSLIGLVNDPAGMTISRYDLSTGTFTTITDYPSMWLSSDETAFDPVMRRYAFTVNPQIFVVDVDSGDLLDQMMIVPANEVFGHISASCSHGTVYGTSANVNEFVKHLSTVDPLTGEIDHVSDVGIEQGVWKPAGGGSCIDHENGMFYWSGAGGLIVGASLTSGSILNEPSSHDGEFFYIECLSQCACITTSLPAMPITTMDIVVIGNSIEIRNSEMKSPVSLSIHDDLGRVIFHAGNVPIGKRVELPAMATGSYTYHLTSESRPAKAGRFFHLDQ